MKTDKQLFTEKQKKHLYGIYDCVMDTIVDLNLGTISITCLGLLKNIEKFWEGYDAILQVLG